MGGAEVIESQTPWRQAHDVPSASYRDNAQRFSQELARWPDGSTIAADLIEKHELQMQNFTNPMASTDDTRSATVVSRP